MLFVNHAIIFVVQLEKLYLFLFKVSQLNQVTQTTSNIIYQSKNDIYRVWQDIF